MHILYNNKNIFSCFFGHLKKTVDNQNQVKTGSETLSVPCKNTIKPDSWEMVVYI